MDDKTIKKEEEAGIQYENTIRNSTKQDNMKYFLFKVCVMKLLNFSLKNLI